MQRGSAQQHDPLSDVWELDLRKMEEEERFEWSHNNTVRSCRRVLTHPVRAVSDASLCIDVVSAVG